MDVMQKSQRPHIIAEHQRYKTKKTKKKAKTKTKQKKQILTKGKKKSLKYNTNP